MVRWRGYRTFGHLVPVLLAIAVAVSCGARQPQKSELPPEARPKSAPLDATSMVFETDRDGHFEIYAARRDGSEPRQLTASKDYESKWPRLSPDRRTVLFYRTPTGWRGNEALGTELWLMGADGSDQRRARERGADGWEAQGHAEWSPDGERMVMHGGPLQGTQIYVTDGVGRNPKAITNRVGRNLDPSWAPDGQRVVFVGCPGKECRDEDLEVYEVPAAGGAEMRLTDNTLRDNDPYFSPDGGQIAWISETQPNAFRPGAGSWNILVMNADGSDQRRLTNDRQINGVPRWAPDGSRVFFSRYEPGQTDRWIIFGIKPDGSDLRPVASQGPGNNGSPSL